MKYYTVTEIEKKAQTSDMRVNKGLSPADVGNLVHAVLKEINLTSKISLEALVKKEALNLQLCFTKTELHAIVQIVQKAPKLENGFHEIPFRLKVKKGVITGIIDYTYETKEGWVIVDFKTDSTFDKERYKLQMDIYALALSMAKPKPVLETRLIFLKLGKVHAEPCTPERLRKTEEHLENLIV